jgi:hypothetical protein
MARSIIAVIVGYVLMFLLNFAGFVTMYAVMGPDQAFEPGLYLASTRWIAVSFVLLLITAQSPGWCAQSSPKADARRWLSRLLWWCSAYCWRSRA